MIDAYASLLLHTGVDLPYDVNGSYKRRLDQAAALRAKLRETRPERMKAKPFDASDPQFKKDIRRVVGWLGGKRVNDRLIAHKVLELIGPPAVPFLREGLATDNRASQRQCLHMMGRIGSMDASKDLRGALTLADADARAEALEGLRMVGDKGAPVAPMLADPDPEVRAAAARYLGRFPPEDARAQLRKAVLRETLPAARAAMWIALYRLNDADAIEPVRKVFLDGEQIERQAALAAMQERHPDLKSSATDPIEKRRAALEMIRAK